MRKINATGRIDTIIRNNTNRTRTAIQAAAKASFSSTSAASINTRIKALRSSGLVRLAAFTKKITGPLVR